MTPRIPTSAHPALALATVSAALALGACGGGSDDGNPDRLYLAPMGSELVVQLVDEEPTPF